MAKSRILLVGCGGIGTVAALNLEAGNRAEVTCVLRSNHAAVLQKGFAIESCDHGSVAHWRPTQVLDAVPSHPSPPFDYIVCCTKNIPDAPPSLCDLIAPAVAPGQTSIVLIQNGVNIERPFIARFPDNLVLSGVSRTDAHEITPGTIQHKQPDSLDVGAFPHPSIPLARQENVAREFVRIYSAGGKTNCRYDGHVALSRWQKLVYNACLNPICALTGLDTGTLQLDRQSMETLVRPAMREVIQVAAALGHRLPEDVIETTIASNPVEKRISPSMLVDLRKGNLIEHENLLGEVVREADAIGIQTPTLTMLYNLCCAVQLRTKQSRGLISI
ncbi:2-dehydropantoate 2-reductase [Aspergillus steynii IBT 23096]|uniref:2-dehydropantoate 2-reductase n=1 Tax=Aspergillus steynii IBT 23096 TaxID=1392250 RepID=A0A2I2GKZ3_9EURO|nr:2-dehydropantoate 2-reductase [Aspergillus steynii IBT 23096]PLB53544.1 2-dehydropantoate 2-reductase [Aspergillus steynii IBT 23096]